MACDGIEEQGGEGATRGHCLGDLLRNRGDVWISVTTKAVDAKNANLMVQLMRS